MLFSIFALASGSSRMAVQDDVNSSSGHYRLLAPDKKEERGRGVLALLKNVY
jgi:hypothetical protein